MLSWINVSVIGLKSKRPEITKAATILEKLQKRVYLDFHRLFLKSFG